MKSEKGSALGNKWFFCLVGVISGLLWGINDIITNLFSNHMVLDSMTKMLFFSASLALLQDSLSSASIISAYVLQARWRSQWRQMISAQRIMLVSAICSGPLGLLCSILAIAYVGAVYAGAITAAYPLVTLLGSCFYLKESLSRWRVMGVVMGVMAVMAIGFQGATTSVAPHRLWGLGFAFVALFGWGMESVFFSAACTRTQANSSALLALRQLFSSICYAVILLLVALCWPSHQSIAFGLFSWHLLLAGCVVSAGFSYLTYYFCIKVLSASVGTLFNVTFIFWSAMIGVVIGLVTLSWWFWCCAAFLFLGVVLALKE